MKSTTSRIWRWASMVLTIAGLILMGLGAWTFLQQQIEASKPPPARILEVSVEDVEPALLTQSKPTSPAQSIKIEPTATVLPLRSATQVEAAAKPALKETLPRPEQPVQEVMPGQVVEQTAASQDAATPNEAVLLVEAKLLEEASLLLEDDEVPEVATEAEVETEAAETTEVPLSLADNPLLVVEDEEIESAAVAASDLTAVAVGDLTATTAAAGQPLTRIVAESIDLDSEVVDVGWETITQDGVSSNVWLVADYAAGWHRNSVLPGQDGNVVLSAHHNIKGQVFRYTVDLEPGDLVTLYDATQSYHYLVEDKFIVKDKGEPEAVRLENAKWIGPFNEERLTLITCWPFNSNTHRLIVIAKPAGTDQGPAQ